MMGREKQIKELTKELCEKSSCHHKCHDTTDCVVEDEAREVIANFATTKEKQIEEMAKIIGNADQRCYEMECDDCSLNSMELGLCKEKFVATALYKAGYRKQSEGHWIKHSNTYECSVCKEELFIEYAEDYDAIVDWELNFCPFCGAKMKGGEK